MRSVPQPVSLVVRRRLSLQFLSYIRPPQFRNSLDPALIVALKCLPTIHCLRLATHSLLTAFRINTCKSVSKQSTLTAFRINTYEKQGEGGPPTKTDALAESTANHAPQPALPCGDSIVRSA